MRANWDENLEQTAPFVGSVLPAMLRDQLKTCVDRFLAHQAPLLTRRVAAGRIRAGHGDLHAASICVVAGRPRCFDGLEFNARFRCAGVAAEVAFVTMDLDHYGRAGRARVFVGAHVNATRDQDLRALLPFYMCYPAFVRGKVRCLRLAEPDVTAAERTRATAEARAYFDLAWSYAGGLPAPMLIVVIGLPTSGKTTGARALAGSSSSTSRPT